jgi:hypothetical protein
MSPTLRIAHRAGIPAPTITSGEIFGLVGLAARVKARSCLLALLEAPSRDRSISRQWARAWAARLD